MSDIDLNDRDALALHLRSKTALGRLDNGEVNSVLDYLASIGFGAPIEPEPVDVPPPPVDLPPPPAS